MASSRQQLIELLQHGVIAPEQAKGAEQVANLTPNAYQWQQFLNAVLAWIASIALSCAVIFFFAFNWSDMGRFIKFALIEGCLLITIFFYFKAKPYSLISEVSLTLSCMLVGAMMALFGQTYQTGADPWQLFFYWALVITPWAIVAQFSVIWLLWFALLNIAIVLYCDIHNNPLTILFNATVNEFWLLFIFNLTNFIVWKYLSRSHSWMQKNWVMRLLAIAAGISITSLAVEAVIELQVINILALVVWFISLMSLYYCYRIKQIDLFMLAGGCASILIVVTVWLVNQFSAFDDMFHYMALAIVVLGLGVAAAVWLKLLQREMHHEC